MVAIETPDTAKPQSRARSLRKAASRASGKSGFFSGKSKSVERADLEEAAEPTAAEPPVETPADAAAAPAMCVPCVPDEPSSAPPPAAAADAAARSRVSPAGDGGGEKPAEGKGRGSAACVLL